MESRLRIGYVPYTNMLPFFLHLNRDDRFQWIEGVPSEMNRLLANGDIDMAPISAFAYGEHWNEYVALDRLCVAADGPVGSIFLISKIPIEQLNEKNIALTSSSATSVNLIRILLTTFYGLSVNYDVMSPDLERMMEQHDAALLIADDAIDSLAQREQYYFYDVGALWKQHTGRPMVYAVMAARESVFDRHLVEFQELHRSLLEAKDRALANLEELAAYTARLRGGDHAYWFHYFSHLRYGFEPYLRAGLDEYFRHAHQLGLLRSIPEIRVREAVFL